MRVLHYSHDHFGVDNLQRTLSVTKQVASEFPEVTQLVVTGSPQPRDTKLPRNVDYIKLPSKDESSNLKHHSPSLLLPIRVIKDLCETLILDTIRCFKPDVVFVEAEPDVQEAFSRRMCLKQDQIETRIVFGKGHQENGVQENSVMEILNTLLLKPIVIRALNTGIKDFRFYDMRHTVTSHLAMAGVNLSTVKRAFGP